MSELIKNLTSVDYRTIVQLPNDLATLADRDNTRDAFDERYGQLRLKYATKKALLRQLEDACE
ncbi:MULTISPECIES: hypothetical protein [Streptomyces]|uniref:Uncharacterized protein n=1 Tax=Streptomyces ehimensis TaxID=68195 RepID=A0ABV9BUS5_9ACTN